MKTITSRRLNRLSYKKNLGNKWRTRRDRKMKRQGRGSRKKRRRRDGCRLRETLYWRKSREN